MADTAAGVTVEMVTERKEAEMPMPVNADHPEAAEPRVHDTRLHVEEEHELERRTRAAYRAAERGGMQWRPRSPNQRFVAHRRGNR